MLIPASRAIYALEVIASVKSCTGAHTIILSPEQWSRHRDVLAAPELWVASLISADQYQARPASAGNRISVQLFRPRS